MAKTDRHPPAWVLICAAWTIPALLSAFDQYMQGPVFGQPPPPWRSVVYNAVDWFLYALLTPLVLRLMHRSEETLLVVEDDTDQKEKAAQA